MIHILSKETIDKIAAGEVAERPESVVKELLDNAVDAKADAVSVEIRGGGLDLIRVTDNGAGIAAEEIPTAFIRHATSKLETAADIAHIRTMGFRGEALASIAAVARVELISRTADALTGLQYRIEQGREIARREVGAPTGTTVVVRDFLENVPVRRQFLKSKAVENAGMIDVVEKAALAHPDVSFSLTLDGKNLLHTTGSGRLKDVVYQIYGPEITANLLELDYSAPGETLLHIRGLIGRPVITRSRRDYEVFIVNGRAIVSDVLSRAAEDAYAAYLMQHKFPMLVLHLEMNPEEVDVNVHPRKTELRFADGGRVREALMEAIDTVLGAEEHVVDALGSERGYQKAPKNAYRAAPGSAAEGTAAEGSSADSTMVAAPSGFRTEPFEKQRAFDYVGSVFDLIRDSEEPEPTGEPGAGNASGGRRSENNIPEDLRENQKTHSNTTAGLYDRVTAEDTGGVAESAPPYAAGILAVAAAENQSTEETKSTKTGRQAQPTKLAQAHAAQSETPVQAARAGQAKTSLQSDTLGQAKAENKAESAPQILRVPGEESNRRQRESTDAFLRLDNAPYFKLIGQVFETYWIIEYKDEMYLIDQHAAHEKVNYERFSKQILEGTVCSQELYPPRVLTLSAKEAALVEANLAEFQAAGYEIEAAGDRDYVVRAVPANLPGLSEEEVLMDMISGLSEETKGVRSGLLKDKIASMSCKAAVKGNRRLTEPEMRALIGELLTLENPYACPHGRPTIARWSKTDLDKIFKRIV